MNVIFTNQTDCSCRHFNSLVSKGQSMDMKTVDTVARGLVYTGDGALQIGLVDKSGGLDCAILFAQQNVTSSGKAQVLDWPPK